MLQKTGMRDGTFMVRPSSRTVGFFALSLCCAGDCFHYEICSRVSHIRCLVLLLSNHFHRGMWSESPLKITTEYPNIDEYCKAIILRNFCGDQSFLFLDSLLNMSVRTASLAAAVAVAFSAGERKEGTAEDDNFSAGC